MGFLQLNTQTAKVDKSNNVFHGARRQMYKRGELPPPTEEELKEISEEFDFSRMNERVAMFAKYYILNGGNACKAIVDCGLFNSKSENGQRVLGSQMLRRLRAHPDFWEMLGLGYQDLKEVVDTLKREDPKTAAAIMMKVLKEDTERVNHNITIAFEKDLD